MEADVTSSSNPSNLENEGLDPRVQVELENLNAATDEINRLEGSLEEANNAFRGSLNETSTQLQSLTKKLGSCVEKARPYYEAKENAKKLQLECQRAALQYQRANAIHQAARETIALAEERFANLKEKERQDGKERKFDAAWQEMLNHATMKIMEAEAQKSASEREHLRRAAAYTTAEKELQEMNRKFKSAINKSRPYFSHRGATQVKLEAQKDRIHKLQKDIVLAKNKYSLSLRNLEHISEEIHELRRVNTKREPGVGAEVEECEPFIERSLSYDFEANAEEDQKYWSTLKKKLHDMKNATDLSNENLIENEKEFNKNFSILVHEDNISIPYESTGKRSSPGAKRDDKNAPISESEIEIEGKTEEHASSSSSNNALADHKEFSSDASCQDIEELEDQMGGEDQPGANKTDLTSLSSIVGESVRVSALPLLALKEAADGSTEQEDPTESSTQRSIVKNSIKKIEQLLANRQNNSVKPQEGMADYNKRNATL